MIYMMIYISVVYIFVCVCDLPFGCIKAQEIGGSGGPQVNDQAS